MNLVFFRYCQIRTNSTELIKAVAKAKSIKLSNAKGKLKNKFLAKINAAIKGRAVNDNVLPIKMSKGILWKCALKIK